MTEDIKKIVWEGLTCVGWANSDDGPENGLGGMGGWFGYKPGSRLQELAGHRWKDYLDQFKPEAHPALESLRTRILADQVFCSGEDHQNGRYCPKFSDGSVATYSFRGWDDLMAAVWSSEHDKDYGYMDFYMSTPTWKENSNR